METKYEHTKKLLPEKTHLMIELFFEFAQLKNLYHQGWLKRGVSKLNCETVADHSFSVALLGYILAEEYRPDLNSERVMLLGLFHESGEIFVGDITPKDGISLEDKFQREYLSVKNVFSCMPNPEKYIGIWLEYEKKETPEAKFVNQIDKLEMALQAKLYELMDHQGAHKGLEEFFPYVKDRISSPELNSVLVDLLKINLQNI